MALVATVRWWCDDREAGTMRRILRAVGAVGGALAVMLVVIAPAASAGGLSGLKTFVGPADDAFFVDL
jgi:hypothetical protein